MISEGHNYGVRHESGRWLVSKWAWNGGGGYLGWPGGYLYTLTDDVRSASRARNPCAAGRIIQQYYWDREAFKVERAPVCACCGEPELVLNADGLLSPYRCEKHRHRNPCAIEGCARTGSAIGTDGKVRLGNDQWLCGEHWRRYVPPRSARRRAYHAFFRKGKRYGWTMKLDRQFRRFWDQLIRTARAKADGGSIDEAEINRMFGWDAEAG